MECDMHKRRWFGTSVVASTGGLRNQLPSQRETIMVFMPILAGVARNWWVLALRGLLAVLFAFCAFIWPGLTLGVLVLLWGAFAIVDGVIAIAAGASTRWWSQVFFGVLGVVAGLIALFMPGITALALLMVIAAWAIVRGVFEIVAAIRLRKELTGEWLLILAGAVSVAFGVLMVLYPAAGALAVVWLIGLQALMAGIFLFALAFRLRGISKEVGTFRADLGGETPSGPRIGA
jgi:uncharacterized membrane protein HdeD (DUF308 family)